VPEQVHPGSHAFDPVFCPVHTRLVPRSLHLHIPHRPHGPESAPGQHEVVTHTLLHMIAFAAHLQLPVAGSHTWLAPHVRRGPGLHVPALHWSPTVHMLLSVHALALLCVTHP
jgi:hypothetical protein